MDDLVNGQTADWGRYEAGGSGLSESRIGAHLQPRRLFTHGVYFLSSLYCGACTTDGSSDQAQRHVQYSTTYVIDLPVPTLLTYPSYTVL